MADSSKLKKLRAIRGGHRGTVSKTLNKALQCIVSDLTSVTIDALSTSLSNLRLYVSTVKEKLTHIAKLNSEVLECLDDEAELTSEVMDADSFEETAQEHLITINTFITTAVSHVQNSQASVSSASTGSSSTSPQPQSSVASNTSGPAPAGPSSRSSSPVSILSSSTSSVSLNSGGSATHVPNLPGYDGHRLPKLTLPTFSGDTLQWLSFWDSFSSAVHSNRSLSDVQKFNYLRAQLQGSALSCISGLSITALNYSKAVDLLKSRFGQPHKVISAHMSSLMNLAHPRATASSLRTFYDTIQCHVRGLHALGKSEDSYGDLLVSVVLHRLPKSTLEHLTRCHGSSAWTFAALLLALQQEVDILEARETDGQNTTEAVPTAAFVAKVQSSKPAFKPKQDSTSSPVCVYCGKAHRSVDCDSLSTPSARLSFVKDSRRCFNCLGKHLVAKCTARGRCHRCSKKHHTSLCTASDHDSSSSSSGPGQRSAQLNVNAPAFQAPSSSTAFTMSSDQSSSCTADGLSPSPVNLPDMPVLLKTAIAPVRSGANECTANILFDEGAQRTFVSSQLAESLQLPHLRTESVKVATFGGNSSSLSQCPVVDVSVVCSDSSLAHIQALVIPDIASFLHHYPAGNAVELKQLTLAHPVSKTEWFNVSLLIGADYYWQFVGDDIVRSPNGPTAVSSRLGYLLSGPSGGSAPSQTSVFCTLCCSMDPDLQLS